MKSKYLITLFLILTGLSACNNTSVEPVSRTVLVYMVESDLKRNLEGNLNDMIDVANAKNLKGGNLVVFYSSGKDKAELFQIKEDKDKIVRKHHIKDYEGQSAIAVETMKNVIKDVVSLFPAEDYGMIFSSHGTAWMPGNYERMKRSFGEENGKNMEIYDLAAALPDHLFNFLLFDACSMGSIECVYELKDKADYIMASASETMVFGYPYKVVTPFFFTPPKADLTNVAKSFYDFYINYDYPYGNVSVTKTANLDELAAITKEIVQEHEGFECFFSLPLTGLQTLSYLPSSPTRLLDFRQTILSLASEEQKARFDACLNKTVISKYTTPVIFCSKDSNVPVNPDHYSGLSVYAPQPNLTQLNDWYKQLKWSQTVFGN